MEDKQWFYKRSLGSDREGPINEAEFNDLIRTDSLGGGDLVWCEGMSGWKTLDSVVSIAEIKGVTPAELSAEGPGAPPPPQSSQAAPALDADTLLEGLEKWMGFSGIMTIITGALACLGCVGIIYGVFMILGGIALMGAKNSLSQIEKLYPEYRPFLENMLKASKMIGICYIAGIVTSILFMILYFGVFAAAFATATTSGM